MKKILTLLFGLILCNFAIAQSPYYTQVKLNSYVEAGAQARIEKTLSDFMTEIARAHSTKSNLNLSGIKINEYSKLTVMDIWNKNSRFVLPGRLVKFPAVKWKNKDVYRITPVVFLFDKEYEGEQVPKEYIIEVDANGMIVDFMRAGFPLALEGSSNVSDEIYDKIYHFLGELCTAHCSKNLSYLTDIYSDDALFITGFKIGKVTSTRRFDERDVCIVRDGYKLVIKDKKQYLADLNSVFLKNAWISIKYENITITRHANKNYQIYIVKMKQIYNSPTYSDEGYLTLVWDMSDVDKPQILQRTWFDEVYDYK